MADLAHSPTLAAHPVTGSTERLAQGARAGEYLIDRFIGAGAMGEVYAGHHPVIGKRVAIKVLRRELAASEEAAKRFIREAQAVNQIDHPNVVDIFAFGRLDDGRLYLVMDLVEGRSLRETVSDGPMEMQAALEILAAIADALDAAHARGVVHRDLKPDNIVLSERSKVFVLDFGIAKLVSKVSEGEKPAPGTLTGQGTWMGTPGYMAPEQWSVDGAGTASDRYALGVIAFELLSGKLPFSATSVPAMMEQHFRAEVPALSARGVIAPDGVDAVLGRAMAKDPAARFATARAMVEALRAASGTGRGARAAHEIRTAPEEGRKMFVPAVAGAGVMGLAIVAFFAVRSRHDESDKRPAPAAIDSSGRPMGTVRIDVMSTPAGAEVRQGDRIVGSTPVPMYLKPSAETKIVVRKPGYLPDERTITAHPSDSVEQIPLVAVTQFEGVWQLKNGELRAFDRRADQVDISKLDEVAGAKHFYRHYDFVSAEHGVAFATEEEVVDQRAPDDPRCHIPVHVEYRYTPADDTLELHRDVVEIDGAERCVVHSRKIETTKLARVDNPTGTREMPAPAGLPPELKTPTRKTSKVLPLDPKAAVQQKIDAAANFTKKQAAKAAALKQKLDKQIANQKPVAPQAANQPFNTVGKQPTSPYTNTKNRAVDNMYQGDSQQAQNPAPPQQAPPPQVPPPQQQQARVPNQAAVKN